MIKGKKISVIIPCKNEAEIIASLIREIPSCVDEVIVIDNDSSDNTFSEAKNAGAIVLKEKRAINGIGYGYAHQTGLALASGDYFVAIDGDKTYPSFEIKKIIDFMEKEKVDFVSCNRLPLKNKSSISKTRKLGIIILNWVVRLLYGYPIKDTLTGMWVTKKEVVEKLNLKQGGWDFSPEIKLSAISHPEIKFEEYHINAFVRNGDVSKQKIWRTGIGHFIYILKRRYVTDNPFLLTFDFFNKVLKPTLSKI